MNMLCNGAMTQDIAHAHVNIVARAKTCSDPIGLKCVMKWRDIYVRREEDCSNDYLPRGLHQQFNVAPLSTC